MMQSYHLLDDLSHRIRSEPKFKDDTILPPSRWLKSPDPFWTKFQGWYNPTTFSRTEVTGSILSRGLRMIQSYHILEDWSHRIHYGQMSQDDTIPLHSRGPRSPDLLWTDVSGWYKPTATSLLPLTRKVFLNNTKLVLKVFEIYSR